MRIIEIVKINYLYVRIWEPMISSLIVYWKYQI